MEDLSTKEHLPTTSLEELLSTTEISPVSACTPDDFTFSDIEYFQLDFPLIPSSAELPLTSVSLGSGKLLLSGLILHPEFLYFYLFQCHR